MNINEHLIVHKLKKEQLKYLPLKRTADIMLSSISIIVLSPLFAGISIAIKMESHGPIFFKQKRIGENKRLFNIYKFRTMKANTPKDMPTHMLNNPNKYITGVGKLLRKTSLDELPQLWNVLKGDMSLIGPRPALWNQKDLIAERDKYGANYILPGLTGWAQINGRDELEIPIKAKLDGEYVEKLNLWMDIKCLFGTIGSVLSHDGVVEGGTGSLHKSTQKEDLTKNVKKKIAIGGAVIATGMLICMKGIIAVNKFYNRKKNEGTLKAQTRLKKEWIFGGLISLGTIYTVYENIKRKIMLQNNEVTSNLDFNNEIKIDEEQKNISFQKKIILITGKDSYLGMAIEVWLNKTPEKYRIETIDMQEEKWKKHDFSQYDVVYHVAGIAHADVGNVSEEQRQLYYKVNTELAIEVAKKAKAAGVKQFIFMSSIIVYAGCKEKFITKDTEPKPLNFYGNSKWKAEQKIRGLSDSTFKVVIIRPPMIYGKGSKGNYPKLVKLAGKTPVFPIVKNKRSMLYIDNLCEFIKLMIDNKEEGVFYPQNREYTNTSDLVQMIANIKGHKIIMLPFTNIFVKMVKKMSGKIGELAEKAFGDFAYDMGMSDYKEDYRVRTLVESIWQMEK